MDNPRKSVKYTLKKAVTFSGESRPSKKSRRRSSSQKKKKQNVRRESVLKPSVYQKIQKKRKSQMLEKKRKSLKLAPILSNTTTSNTGAGNTETAKSDNRRTVFISLRDFYQCWRCIPANILSDSILILPLYKEWISQSPATPSPIPPIANLTDILSDTQFITLLQWKDKQGLLFYMLNHVNTHKSLQNAIQSQDNTHCNDISPFWHQLSHKLERLYDPDRCDRYRPLLLNERWWKFAFSSMYSSKFNVCSREVLNELHFFTMKFKCMQEILYQSNPSLNVVIEYFGTNNQQLKALESIKNILKQPNNIKIDIKSSENEVDSDLNCDVLQSPSNASSSSHVIGMLMNSGSEADDIDVVDEDIKLNYNDKSSSSGEESVSSSAMFAHIAPIAPVDVDADAVSSSTSCPSLNNDMEWWVCPHYYYDTMKSKMDTDCDTVSDY